MMDINIWVVLAIIVIHWFADFVLQTHWQATNKSKNNLALLLHTMNYSSVFTFIGIFLIPTFNLSINLYWFGLITFFCHTITDYFTSRLNNKLWIKGDTHNFFVSIGFDQLLHYTQLILLYQILK